MRLVNFTKKFHDWMKKDPCSVRACNIFSGILFTMAGGLFAILVRPQILQWLSLITNRNLTDRVIILTVIFGLLCGFVAYVAVVVKILRKKEVAFPVKYKVLFSILATPFIFLIHKIIIILVPNNKTYEREN